MRHSPSRTFLAGIILGLGCLTATAQAEKAKPSLTSLSSDPRFVAGGDVLVRFDSAGGDAARTAITVDGAPAQISRLSLTPDGHVATALVGGLSIGRHLLVATAASGRAELAVVNHDAAGPIFPGTDIHFESCSTDASGLGSASLPNCMAPTKIEYFYRTTSKAFKPLPSDGSRPGDLATLTLNGVETPYIVRVESGVLSRSIYRIAVLDDPAHSASDPKTWRPGSAWNHRLVIAFGGGCGGHFTQGGDKVDQALSDLELSHGFAYVVSPTLVNQQFCSPLVQGEALVAIKQHVVKTYGLPVWTLGVGASGGAIEQYTLAQMFPGLLDGLQPGASFPDSQGQSPIDCTVLYKAFQTDPQRWTQPKRAAVYGASEATCIDWSLAAAHNLEPVPAYKDLKDFHTALINTVGGVLLATPYPCDVADASKLYDKSRNPTGLRCSQADFEANQLGRDPNGLARVPFDNVGVQYGLQALKAGVITSDDFLALNTAAGGVNAAGLYEDPRSAADAIGVRNAYATGLSVSGGGGLRLTPIITLRSYMDDLKAGSALAIHDRLEDLIVRARLKRANGSAANQVILTAALRSPVDIREVSLALSTRWLDALAADPRPLSPQKVIDDKPSDATDTCWTPAGEKFMEEVSLAPAARCNQLYPLFSEPRMVAGEGLENDVQKCQLRPPLRADYPDSMTSAQFARVKILFPKGVCDYTKPSVGYVPFRNPFAALGGLN